MNQQPNASDNSAEADAQTRDIASDFDSEVPSRWLALFGPGAIVASLTIGSGELVFSSRGGAVFGYRLIGLFLVICLFKWCLVFMTARHIVLTGAHPFERWCQLPGPRGWLPIAFSLLAVASFPVWVSFHAGTVGTLLAALTSTQNAMDGGGHFFWGLFTLAGVMMLVWSGGYQRLEQIQLSIVFTMLACVCLSLLLLRPNLGEMLAEAFSFGSLAYPEWADESIRARPLWVELATYVGVIGGSGYDYLAYVSFLRDKHWGQASHPIASKIELEQMAADAQHRNRRWIIAPLVDATLSFAIVLAFSAIFLTLGRLVLQPMQLIPDGSDLLTLQAEFVRHGPNWMRPLYFSGALLAMLGTLYGTIEVAPTIARELLRCLGRRPMDPQQLHRRVTGWVAAGGSAVLMGTYAYFLASGNAKPPALIAILTPANLFTGVLACGVISWLAIWSDWCSLPLGLRARTLLQLATFVGGGLFLAIGIKAYWDHSGAASILIFLGTIGMGLFVGWRLESGNHGR